MRPTSSRSPRTSAAESGTTLIELVTTLGLIGAVLAAMFAAIASVQRSDAYVADRRDAVESLRLAMDQVAKEGRQASVIGEGSGASRLELTTYVSGTPHEIVYQAGGGALTRSEDGGAALTLLDALASSDVFTYSPAVPDADTVAVELEVVPERSPDTVVQLHSEFRPRNGGGA